MAGSGTAHLRPDRGPLLTVDGLTVEFPLRGRQVVHAVSGISFDLLEGETLGLVGESGCGKSTTGRAIMGLPRPTGGSVVLDGVELTALEGEELRRTRPQLQMVFQDSIASLNPRRKVFDIVARGLRLWSSAGDAEVREKVDELLDAVGLPPDVVGRRRPHEFSGGQCQRVCIARSLVVDPKLVICDEPVSALDVSVQAQILNLLDDMKRRYGLTLLFISHDLGVVKNVSDRVAVMYLGKLCEVGPPDALYAHPAHHYTKLLIESVPNSGALGRGPGDPVGEGRAGGAPGVGAPGGVAGNGVVVDELPSPIDPPSGCRFRTRCPAARPQCAREEPELQAVAEGHYVACHFPLIRPSGAPPAGGEG